MMRSYSAQAGFTMRLYSAQFGFLRRSYSAPADAVSSSSAIAMPRMAPDLIASAISGGKLAGVEKSVHSRFSPSPKV